MDARLVVVGGKASRSEIKLKLPAMIGRKKESGVMIDHKSVSRQHCEIFLRDGYLFVRDRNSSNGTFINEQRVVEQILNPGDSLRIGPLTFTAAYIPTPPRPASRAGDALMSDAPPEESDFAGFFDGEIPPDGAGSGDSFPLNSQGRKSADALSELDDADAFGWLGAESSGILQKNTPSGPRPNTKNPVASQSPAFPADDDYTTEDGIIGNLHTTASDVGALLEAEEIDGQLETEELEAADGESPFGGDLESLENLGATEGEERSVFAGMESPSLDLSGLSTDESSKDFLGRFSDDWTDEANGATGDARALPDESDLEDLGADDGEPANRAVDEPSSHGDWAVEQRKPGDDPACEGGEATVPHLEDPFGEPPASPPTVSLGAPASDAPPVDDWSKTSLEPATKNPLDGLDLAFDEIDQPSVEAFFTPAPPADATAAAETSTPETANDAPETLEASEPADFDAVSDTDAVNTDEWPNPDAAPPELDLSDDEADVEFVSEDEDLLELELIDEGADAESESVDEDLELEVIEEGHDFGDESPFDDPKEG